MAEDPFATMREEISRLTRRVAELEELHGRELYTKRLTLTAQPAEHQAPVRTKFEPVRQVEDAPAPVRPATNLEEEIGGNWLNKIGAAALVLGVGFFLKYAFDNRWIDETGRIVIGILVGLAGLALGEHFQKKGFARYAQGLSGAGIAILYFTVYAAFSFYSLIAPTPAIGFMVVVTAAAIALAVRYDAVAIAVLGIIGGFLTPALYGGGVGSGGGSEEIRLFSYIAVLDLGILGVTRFKGWRQLNLLSLIGTVLIFAGWSTGYYYENRIGITMLFLTIFFAIFAAQSFVQNVIARRPLSGADIIIAVSPPVLYFATSYSLLSGPYRLFMGGFAVALAALYVVLSRRVFVYGFQDKRLCVLFLCVASGFLIIAVPIQLRMNWITVGWAVEAAAVSAIGIYLKSYRTRLVALGLLGLAIIRVIGIDAQSQQVVAFHNLRFATFLIVAAATAFMAWLYYRHSDVLEEDEDIGRSVLAVAANGLVVWAISVEVLDWVVGSSGSFALSAVWMIYGVGLLLAGIYLKHRPSRLMGIALFAMVIVKTFLYDVWVLERMDRIIAFVGLGICLFLASYLYQAFRDNIRQIVSADDEKVDRQSS